MKARRASGQSADLSALKALVNPVRGRLYTLVAAAGRAISRDEAAGAAGISRSLAAYHLDKLVATGLLEVDSEGDRRMRPRGGRPAKLYRRGRREFVLRAPPRDYQLLSELLVRVAAAKGDGGSTLHRVACDTGRDLGRSAKDELGEDPNPLLTVLHTEGYEPYEDEHGTVRLRNCPFDTVAKQFPEIVCQLNLGLVEGVLDGLEADEARAVLDPGDGVCCVAIRKTAS